MPNVKTACLRHFWSAAAVKKWPRCRKGQWQRYRRYAACSRQRFRQETVLTYLQRHPARASAWECAAYCRAQGGRARRQSKCCIRRRLDCTLPPRHPIRSNEHANRRSSREASCPFPTPWPFANRCQDQNDGQELRTASSLSMESLTTGLGGRTVRALRLVLQLSGIYILRKDQVTHFDRFDRP